MPDHPHRCWPDAADYEYLDGASRTQFAWEWLRRDPCYRKLIPSIRRITAQGLTIVEPAARIVRERWSCLFIEDPDTTVPDVPMLWDPGFDASVLRVEARLATTAQLNGFDVSRCAARAVVVKEGSSGEQCLLFAGRHHVRLHVIAGTLLEGRVMLRFEIDWRLPPEPAISTLRRFLHLCRSGEMSAGRPVPDRTVQRIIFALRVHDALAQGASIRDIGILLFGRARIEAEWRDPGESLKSQCRRLIASARAMADGGYKDLLREVAR